MSNLTVFESDEDFQIIPDGQEHFHDFSDECQCCPKIIRQGSKYACVHNEFTDESLMYLAYISPYHNFRQKYNC